MTSFTRAVDHYDPRTIALHWLTATLVLVLWVLGQTIDWFPKGSPRVAARSAHILLGATLAVVVLLRLHWRFGRGGVRLPGVGSAWMQRLSDIVHKGLYVLLGGTVLLGLVNAWVRGDSIFGLFSLPAFSQDREWRGLIENAHALAANGLLILALCHAAAALFHHLVLRDAVLRRMAPPHR